MTITYTLIITTKQNELISGCEITKETYFLTLAKCAKLGEFEGSEENTYTNSINNNSVIVYEKTYAIDNIRFRLTKRTY